MAQRLIDADAVIAEQYDILQKLYGGKEQTLKDHLGIDDELSVPIHAMEMYSRAKQFYYGLKGIMENAPTVDAVAVVRCRDCKYWGDEAGVAVRTDGVRFARCKVHSLCVGGKKIGWCPTEDDFCSQGERRTGNENRLYHGV